MTRGVDVAKEDAQLESIKAAIEETRNESNNRLPLGP